MIGFSIFTFSLFTILVSGAAISDLLYFKIPNFFPIFLLFLFLTVVIFFGLDLQFILKNVITALIVLIFCFILFSRGYIGGGDAKLIPAICLWSGLDTLSEFLLMTALFGGLLALILIGFRKLNLPITLKTHGWLNRLHAAENQVPYGLAITAGALTTFHKFPIFEYIINLNTFNTV